MAFISNASGPRLPYSFKSILKIPQPSPPAKVTKFPVYGGTTIEGSVPNLCCYKTPRIPPLYYTDAPDLSGCTGGSVSVGTDPNSGDLWCE